MFPERHLPAWVDEVEGFAPSALRSHVTVVLGWRDQLRLLLSGGLQVDTSIRTDVAVTRSQSESVIFVLRPATVRKIRAFHKASRGR